MLVNVPPAFNESIKHMPRHQECELQRKTVKVYFSMYTRQGKKGSWSDSSEIKFKGKVLSAMLPKSQLNHQRVTQRIKSQPGCQKVSQLTKSHQ